MDGKTILLMIAVVAVGMFVLPSTLALYSGSHSFVNGTDVDCTRCHVTGAGIQGQLENGSAHSGMNCTACHGWASDALNKTSTNTSAHAASMSVDCIGCHAGLQMTSGGSDNEPNYVNVSMELEVSSAAHKNLNFNSTDQYFNEDKDAACVACHTKVYVAIYGVTSLVNDTGTDAVINLTANGDGYWNGTSYNEST